MLLQLAIKAALAEGSLYAVGAGSLFYVDAVGYKSGSCCGSQAVVADSLFMLLQLAIIAAFAGVPYMR